MRRDHDLLVEPVVTATRLPLRSLGPFMSVLSARTKIRKSSTCEWRSESDIGWRRQVVEHVDVFETDRRADDRLVGQREFVVRLQGRGVIRRQAAYAAPGCTDREVLKQSGRFARDLAAGGEPGDSPTRGDGRLQAVLAGEQPARADSGSHRFDARCGPLLRRRQSDRAPHSQPTFVRTRAVGDRVISSAWNRLSAT